MALVFGSLLARNQLQNVSHWASCNLSKMLSTSAARSSLPEFHRRWKNTDKWPTVSDGGVMKKWPSVLPRDNHKNEWSQPEVYFGRYDFISILGNDVTLQPKLFCKGPGYVRACNTHTSELKRLLLKRRQLGYRMHLEDLHTINKRIKYLMKVENRVKKTRG